jgi:hypothetical protein
MGTWRGDDTRGPVVSFLNDFRQRLSVVRVDSIGIGHNFALHLSDQRFNVEKINVSMPCDPEPHLGDDDPARRFVNRKAQYYQSLANAFERDLIEGLTDEATIGQLSGLLYEIDSQGRMRLESKESARQRGLPSPDRAEALMLAMCKVHYKFEYIPVPTRRWSSRWTDDLDDDDNPQTRSDRYWNAWIGTRSSAWRRQRGF